MKPANDEKRDPASQQNTSATLDPSPFSLQLNPSDLFARLPFQHLTSSSLFAGYADLKTMLALPTLWKISMFCATARKFGGCNLARNFFICNLVIDPERVFIFELA